jgi:hypothetical protein
MNGISAFIKQSTIRRCHLCLYPTNTKSAGILIVDFLKGQGSRVAYNRLLVLVNCSEGLQQPEWTKILILLTLSFYLMLTVQCLGETYSKQ